MVGRGRFALPKPHKRHIKHELNADLSTSGSLRFSSRIFQMVERVGFAHHEATLSSTVFTILPICLHLGFPSSPLVSLKCVAAHRSRTWCFLLMRQTCKLFHSAAMLIILLDNALDLFQLCNHSVEFVSIERDVVCLFLYHLKVVFEDANQFSLEC